MRIVGGEARGRRLFAPDGLSTRPTADRVRESLFNILSARVPGARVLDLFAGSGALALEALSRGARGAVLVDQSKAAMDAIRRNAEIVRVAESTVLIRADWRRAVDRLDEGFDLVFLDPPYSMRDVYFEAAVALRDRGLLNRGAVLVMEHPAKSELVPAPGFEIYDLRRYGECAIALVVCQA